MEGVNDDTERFSLVCRLDRNKPVWGVALWQAKAAKDLRQSPVRADGKIRQRLTLQMRPQERFILTTRPVFLHEPERRIPLSSFCCYQLQTAHFKNDSLCFIHRVLFY